MNLASPTEGSPLKKAEEERLKLEQEKKHEEERVKKEEEDRLRLEQEKKQKEERVKKAEEEKRLRLEEGEGQKKKKKMRRVGPHRGGGVWPSGAYMSSRRYIAAAGQAQSMPRTCHARRSAFEALLAGRVQARMIPLWAAA